MSHCGLFGDPHLQTFGAELQTCRVLGAWPLVENDYLTVQVTNAPVRSTATVLSKVCLSLCTCDLLGGCQNCSYFAAMLIKDKICERWASFDKIITIVIILSTVILNYYGFLKRLF